MTAPLVLIADNDSAVSSLLAEVLVRRGLLVRQAFDGETAQELARDAAVRVLVCDLDMPRLSGIEVLEGLARHASPPQVVVVSGYLDGSVLDRLHKLPNVREVLRKPFDLLRFADRVQEIAAAAVLGRMPALRSSEAVPEGGVGGAC